MEKSTKVCASILIGLLCLIISINLQATSIVPTFNLFEVDTTNVGKSDFVQNAVFFTINQETLTAIRKKAATNLTLSIPFENNKKLTLNLTKESFLAEDFQVQLQKNNTHSTLFYSPALFYKGAIKGAKDALVALNFFEDKVTGVLSLNGDTYNIGQYEKGGSNAFVLYKEKNLDIPNPFVCSTEDPVELRIERTTASSRSSADNKVRVYIECDNHMYKNMGSNAQKVTDFTTGLFNIVSTLYQNESITLEISEIKIWTTKDPYPTTSAKNARNALGQRLNGNFNGDIAHLLSNYKSNGTPPNGGSANIDVLCNKPKAVSYTNITTSYLSYPTFSWTAYAVSHEIGHNLGSAHTHSCLWPTGPIDNCWCPEGGCAIGPEPTSSGTLMSYCHLDPKWTNACTLSSSNPGINFAAGFGTQPGNLIRSRVSNASCLTSTSATAGGSTAGSNSGNTATIFKASSIIKEETCSGENDGSVTLALSGGQSPYTYTWNTGATSPSLLNASSGVYAVTITDKNGKEATTSATIKAGVTIRVDAGSDQVISCGGGVVLLDASNSVTGFQYNDIWSKVGANLTSGIYSQVFSASESGTYVYTVTDRRTGCSVSDTVEVRIDSNTPSLQLSAANLACNNPSVQLLIATNLTNANYKWTGPNGFSSTAAQPTVARAGVYQVTVNTTGGCASQGQVTVQSDISQPTVTALGGTIDCETTTVQLSATSNEQVAYTWSGPNGFTSREQNPTTTLSGLYSLVVTSGSGCTNATTAQVGRVTKQPIVSTQGGTLTCTQSSLALQVTTNEANLNYNWTGPNGFTSTSKNPTVTTAGTYVLDASFTNGCNAIQTVVVSASTDTPTFQINAGTLDCNTTSTTLQATTTGIAIDRYQWTGPNGFLSYEAAPVVTSPGTYSLTASGKNGCSGIQSYTVISNNETLAFSIEANSLTCNQSTTTLAVNTQASTIISSYQWTGPNGFLSTEATPQVNVAGTYTLSIVNSNGCAALQSINVVADFELPVIEIFATDLTCTRTTTQINASTNNTGDRFTWSGPNNFTSTESNPVVSEPGVYAVTVHTTNGCTNQKTVEIKATGLEVANIDVKNDYCGAGEGSIRIQMKETTEEYYVAWNTGQNGLAISNLPAGTYTATIKDRTGCITTVTEVIEANPSMALDNVSVTNISCNGAADGRIALEVKGGKAPYELLWSNGREGTSNDGLEAGTHTLEIIDATNCVKTFYFEMINPEAIEVTTEIAEGEAEFLVTGGEGDYTFDWSNGLNSEHEIGLENGAYSVTIQDANGCQVVEAFDIESIDIVENSVADVVEVVNVDVPQEDMIYPNPADTHFNLYYELGEEQLVFISIFNAQGYYLFRKTMEAELISETIQTSGWENGTYYVQILTKDGFITEELKVVHN